MTQVSNADIVLRIGLLSLVTDTPSPAFDLDLPDTNLRRSSNAGTSFEPTHELFIAQHFAFLCSYSVDSAHVMAVAVDTCAAPSSLRLVVASNQGSHEVMLQSMSRVGHILTDEAVGVNRDTNFESMYNEVIALHRPRILERLRSKHSKSLKARGKKSLVGRLWDAESILRSSNVLPAHTLSGMRESLSEIQSHFDRLEAVSADVLNTTSTLHYFVVLLESLIRFADQYKANLHRIDSIPGMWEVGSTQGIHSRLDKLTEYSKACKGLLRASRRFQCFKSFSIHFLHDRIKHARGEEITVKQLRDRSLELLAGRIGVLNGQSLSTTQSRLQSFLERKTRLHAEMQIMVYLDTTMSTGKPRFIVSGKRSCFLCHLMLSLHDHFYAVSSHGRLYDTWCVPPTIISTTGGKSTPHQRRAYDSQGGLREAFAKALDCKIEELLAQKSKIRRAYPMESTINVVRSITPSVLSRSSSQVFRGYSPQSLAPQSRLSSGILLTGLQESNNFCLERDENNNINLESPGLVTQRSVSKITYGYVATGHLELFLEYETTSSPFPPQSLPVDSCEIVVEVRKKFPSEQPRAVCIDTDNCAWVQSNNIGEAFFGEGILLIAHGTTYLVTSRKYPSRSADA